MLVFFAVVVVAGEALGGEFFVVENPIRPDISEGASEAVAAFEFELDFDAGAVVAGVVALEAGFGVVGR